LPRPRVRPPPRVLSWVGLLATRGSGCELELLLVRGDGSLFGGLWNLPACEGRGRRVARELCARLELAGTLAPRRAGEVEHVLTHLRLQVELWRVDEATAANAASPALRAVRATELDALGVSRLTRKALEVLEPPG
jgi:adenine-specific DNA glycosylase